MEDLKANTETIVTIGPFVDVGDGFTPQTDITLGGNEAELMKHGATVVVDISGATWAAVANCRGYYSLTLTTSHTDTEGRLVVVVQDDSDCLPVKAEYRVLSEAAYDSLYAPKDSGVMSVDVTQIGGDAQSATDLKDFADQGYNPATNKVLAVELCDTTTANSDMRGTDSAALATGLATHDGKLDTVDGIVDDLKFAAILVDTTIATVGRSTTTCRLTAGSNDDDAYVGMTVILEDDDGDGHYVSRTITEYSATNKLVTWAPAITDTPTDGGRILVIPDNTNVPILIADNTTVTAIVAGQIGTPVALDGAAATIGAMLTKMADDNGGADFDAGTDSLQELRDRGDAAWTTGAGGSDRLLMVDTTIAVLSTQVSFTLTAGSADNDAYVNCTIVVEDSASAVQKAVGVVSAYTGATKTVTLKYDPGIFTMANGDKVYILAENALKSTAQNRQLAVSATGGVDVTEIDGSASRASDLAEIAQYLIANAVIGLDTFVADNSILGKMLAIGGDVSNYDEDTDSLEAIANAVVESSGVIYNPDASSVITTGTEDANTYAACVADDGVKWTIGDANGANTIEVICEFNMGAGRLAAQLDVNGYYNRSGAGGYKVLLYAWNYTTALWVPLQAGTANLEMRDRGSDKDYVWPLSESFTDQTTTPGEVKIRFMSDRETTQNGDVLYLDYVGVIGQASAAISPEAIALAVHDELDVHLRHIPSFAGNIHYVDADTGDDVDSGHTPDSAFATIGAGVAASVAGDYIKVSAGTYTETGLDMNLAGLELHGEIGAIIDPASGSALTISAEHCLVELMEVRPAAGEIGFDVASGSDHSRIINSKQTATGGTGIKVDSGTSYIQLLGVEVCEYTSIGIELDGKECILRKCTARGDGGAETGYKLNHTNAERNLLDDCTSIDNATASFHAIAGADDNQFLNCSDSAGCGAIVDAGTDNSWRGLLDVDNAAAAAVTAAAVWDALTADHTTANTTGEALRNVYDRLWGRHVQNITQLYHAFYRVEDDSLMGYRKRIDSKSGDDHIATFDEYSP